MSFLRSVIELIKSWLMDTGISLLLLPFNLAWPNPIGFVAIYAVNLQSFQLVDFSSSWVALFIIIFVFSISKSNR